ncbi:MAG: zinc-ribbon domain-containing protein, partial [Alphaproteobacteria bacterium]|nr:zinc-ribbon domain-containing protein [Alphaproteobacteria bacterium]
MWLSTDLQQPEIDFRFPPKADVSVASAGLASKSTLVHCCRINQEKRGTAALECPRCQFENPDDDRFCGGCGAPLEKTCSSCGHANRPNVRFCGGCGTELAGAEPPGRAEFAAPQSYTPKHLADRIRTARGAVEGERKQVTVLFADIQGSLELIQGSDPERVQVLLDSAIRTMMEAVHRYEGTVNKVLGDGVMALFGAPVALEDHAVRACYAALAIQDAIGRHGEAMLHSHGVALQVRVGLHSGEVVV